MNIILKLEKAEGYSKDALIQSAHQPNFIPWVGYFAKMNQSHVFVFSDDVRFSKQQPTNRAKFLGLTNQNFQWTVPVKKASEGRIFEKLISSEDRRIFERGLERVRNDYRGASYYQDLCFVLEQIKELERMNDKLSEFNIECISFIAKSFDIEFLPLLGSKLGLQYHKSNERLIHRARTLGIPKYLCGQGASSYQDDDFLSAQGVQVIYSNYSEINEDFGVDAKYSILHLIALYGINRIRKHFLVSAYRSNGVACYG